MSVRGILCSTSLIIFLTTACAPSPKTGNAGETARQVVDKMVRTYSECSSYRDRGKVEMSFQGVIDNKPFSTLFVRPELFRFEFQHRSGPGFGPMQRYVVWADGENIRSWWTVKPAIRDFDSIEKSLGGPTGVSGGAAVNIPALLMQEMVWGQTLRLMVDPSILGTEAVDQRPCYKIGAGTLGAPDRRITVWVDEESFLVRKIVQTLNAGGMSVEVVTSYHPEINVEIPRERFKFAPPEEATK